MKNELAGSAVWLDVGDLCDDLRVEPHGSAVEMRRALLAAACLLTACQTTKPIPVPADSKETCGPVTGTQAKYCLNRVVDVPKCALWYWHGLDEDEHTARSTKYPHPELWAWARKFSCDILALSWGKSWMIGSDREPLIGNQSPVVSKVDTAMSFVETKHALSTKRVALGVSMGGFNLYTMAAAHPELFKGVVIAHPVMTGSEIGAMTALALVNFSFSKWYNQANPVTAVSKISAFPKAYTTACRADSLVKFSAPEEFFRAAKKKGLDMVWHEDAVGCAHGKFDETPAEGFVGSVLGAP